MKKKIAGLGKVLGKAEQKKIIGGGYPVAMIYCTSTGHNCSAGQVCCGYPFFCGWPQGLFCF